MAKPMAHISVVLLGCGRRMDAHTWQLDGLGKVVKDKLGEDREAVVVL